MPANRLVEALLDEEPSDPLVIHLHDRSTDFLTPIYAGKNYSLVSQHGIRPEELLEAIKAHPCVYGLGHGTPSGLIGVPAMSSDVFRSALAEKPDGVYIWCHAAVYAQESKLSGFVSGMFISEVGEARYFGIDASQQEVDASNHLFARLVRKWLDGDQAPVRQGYSDASNQIVKFNSQRLYIFKRGVPDHPILSDLPTGNAARVLTRRGQRRDAYEAEIEERPFMDEIDSCG